MDLFLPLAGVIAWSLWSDRSSLLISKVSYFVAWISCILYFVVFVVSYGFYIYDWRVAQIDLQQLSDTVVENPSQVGGGVMDTAAEGENMGLPRMREAPKAYLLARLEDGYFFWVVQTPLDLGRIVSLRSEDVTTISFRLDQVFSLRQLRSRIISARSAESRELETGEQAPAEVVP